MLKRNARALDVLSLRLLMVAAAMRSAAVTPLRLCGAMATTGDVSTGLAAA